MGAVGKSSNQNTRPRDYVVGDLTAKDIAQWVKNNDEVMSTDKTTIQAILGGSSIDVNYDDISMPVMEQIKDIIIKNRKSGVIDGKWYRNVGDDQIIYNVYEKNGSYYMRTKMSNSMFDDKISYAKNPEKAYINVKYVGKVQFNQTPELMQILKYALY